MNGNISTEGTEWVKWRSSGYLFYGRSEEVVMRVPYRIEGHPFMPEKPQLRIRIPPGVEWVDPFADGRRAIVIRSEDART